MAVSSRPQKRNHMIRFNHSDQFACAIENREGAKIVFVEQLGYLLLVRVRLAGDETRLCEHIQPCLRQGKHHARQRNDSL